MSKKHIIRIDGKTVEVSDEIYTFLKRSEWNNNYAELRRKRERIIIDSEAMTVKIIPGKEDSLERLAQLTADERFLIYELYYSDKTERELAEELHKTQQNIHKMKHRILCKLYEILK